MRSLRKYTTFDIFNHILLAVISLICLLPMLHILAVSLSGNGPAAQYIVGLWPVEFTTIAYETVMKQARFWSSFFVSIERVLLGVAINMLITIMMAYPLSKETSTFRGRNIYIWVIVFTMLFGGGLIPSYMVIKNLHMLDTIWALVLPGAVPVFNVILMINFIRQLPKQLEEASVVDGASQWMIMSRVTVPLSLPVIATVTLFSAVGHWNAWFDGLIYMNTPTNYPLQTYLHTVLASRNLINADQQTVMQTLTDRTSISAQIILASTPILIVYPFLQKYFIHGIVMGSVKE